MKKKIFWLIPVTIIAALAAAFGIYVMDYYRADAEAVELMTALEKTKGAVHIEETGYGWFFDGPSEESALIFYPGGKVEETAYTPFLKMLAEKGMDVCLVKMPFHLAFFDADAAEEIMPLYSYENWYIGGHSLGGVSAVRYASEHGEELKGVILCASYPAKPLKEDLIEVIIYGSEDQVLNQERVRESRKYAPEHVVEYVIEGGNHAQFGNYGEQKGDGAATISASEQQEEAADVISRFLVH